MTNGQNAVWFNQDDQARFKALGIQTPLKDKVKGLFYDFLDGKEASKIALSTETIENITRECIKKVTAECTQKKV